MEDDDYNFDNFPHDFKNYVKSPKLSWRRLEPMNSGVFWSEDAVESESSPTHSSGGVPNSASETLTANGKVTVKIRSVIEKVFFNTLYIVKKVNAELQDAGLEKSDTYGHLVTPVDYKAHNQVLVELSKGMKVVCETHKLLLSLAWVPCSCGRDAELDGSCNKRYVSCKGQVVNAIVCMETFYASDVKRKGPLTQRNQENESVQRAEDRATRPTVASVEPSALAISAQPEEPQGEMVIENEGTSRDPITPEGCHQDLNLGLDVAGASMLDSWFDDLFT
ncbi:Protein NLP7 [Camellia lanceoleosa]|uniref:Protein NLP7 n=1 Tax=Camellia lanceoleosa TaxID=1840588 RepID=A0ACC0G290_9ERIC|nr:Protein NLP7 [Camellia lanceoleosa]